MAVMIACKRAPISKLLFDRSRAVARSSSSSAIRTFNTNAQMEDDDSDEEAMGIDRRRSRGGDYGYPSFPDVFAAFNPTHSSLSQVLNLMDQMSSSGFPASARSSGGGARRGLDVREDADTLHVRVDMPGLGKEHVKVSAEQNTLVIRGEGDEEERYGGRIELPEGAYRMEGIKAEMKNGVLKVTVPKVKQEERKDVFQVKVE